MRKGRFVLLCFEAALLTLVFLWWDCLFIPYKGAAWKETLLAPLPTHRGDRWSWLVSEGQSNICRHQPQDRPLFGNALTPATSVFRFPILLDLTALREGSARMLLQALPRPIDMQVRSLGPKVYVTKGCTWPWDLLQSSLTLIKLSLFWPPPSVLRLFSTG